MCNPESIEQQTIRIRTFRLHCKTMFLTYPATNISKESALQQLQEKFKKYTIEDYLIVQEKHHNPDLEYQYHLHVYIKLKKTLDTTLFFFFDLIDEKNMNVHGEYQAVRSVKIISSVKGGS